MSKLPPKMVHARAYDRWSASDDARLLEDHRAGYSVADLAKRHQRKPGAIESRLRRLMKPDPSAKQISYDYAKMVGVVVIEEGCCCDMTICIDFFSKLDPRVKEIHTFSGVEPDTIYRRTGDQWEAFRP